MVHDKKCRIVLDLYQSTGIIVFRRHIMDEYSIGQLAKAVGVNIETLRYYERQKLIPIPPRNQSGHRVYPKKILKRLNFIKQAQRLGFTLKEIHELLTLRVEPGTTCKDVRTRVEAKIEDVDHRMAELVRMKDALTRLSSRCTGQGPVDDCPILEALEDKDV